MSLIARVVLLALAVPFVLASGDGCSKDQFMWPAKNVCLPNGGPSNPPSPPPSTDCPFNWYWHTGKGCCAPTKSPEQLPPPQCPGNSNWNSGSLCCKSPPTTPTTTKPPTPSKTPGNSGYDGDKDNSGKSGNGHRKRMDVKRREHRSRNVTPCPKGLFACPVSSLTGGDYECVDTLVDLDNCGGCAALGEGQNCNAIPGVWNVGCEQSACKIHTCAEGYTLSKDRKSCNPL